MYEKLGDQVSRFHVIEEERRRMKGLEAVRAHFADTRRVFCVVGDVPAGLSHGRDASFPGAFLPVWEENSFPLEDGDGGLKRFRSLQAEGESFIQDTGFRRFRHNMSNWPFKIPFIIINLN